jgi:VWFA-related protein
MRRGGRRNIFIMVLALAAISVPVLVGAAGSGRPGSSRQAKSQASGAALQHEVTVTLKLIQVFVTDARGKAAMDLNRSDFVLTDNGALQAITDFESHVLAVAATGRAEAAPSPVPSSKTAAPLLNRKFFFIIDYLRNDLEGVQKAKNAVLEFLDTKVQPGDQVSLYTLSPIGGLTLLDYLTTAHEKLRRTLAKLRDTPGITPVAGESELYGHESMGMELLAADVFGRHGGHGGTGSRNHFAEIASWAKSLRAIQGQKNVILFSRGFGESVIRPGDSANPLFQLMTRELATANAPVFTINTTTGVDAKIAQGVFPESSLDYLSRTTGGRYFPDVNYYARIATDIQDSTANYYVLGYSIPAAWDGKYHDVKVDVVKLGYKVYAQRGYFNPVPFGKLSPIEKHLHLLGLALGDAASAVRDMDFPMVTVPFATGEGAGVLLLSEIAAESIRKSIGDRTEFVSLVLNGNNAIVDGKRVEIDWKDFGTGKVYQYSTVSLEPGRYDCRAVIRNLDDGRAAVGSCSIDVASPQTGAPTLFPPLFLVRGPEAQYLNVASQVKGSGEQGLSISRIFPFPAKEYVPLVGPLEPGATSLFATLRCEWKGERRGEGQMDLSAWLSPDGSEEREPVELKLLDSSSRDEADFYLLEFGLPDNLIPGRYRLEIQAEDMVKGSIVRTTGSFTVR